MIVRLTLIGVALVLIGTVMLIFDVTVGLSAAVWAGLGMLAVLIALGLLPVILGRGRGRAAR